MKGFGEIADAIKEPTVQKPTPGRIVHVNWYGQTVPAIVTGVWVGWEGKRINAVLFGATRGGGNPAGHYAEGLEFADREEDRDTHREWWWPPRS